MKRMTLSARLRAYLDHPDPLAATVNLVAFVVGANGPFYPLYAMALIGRPGAWLFITMAASPVFLAIPALARRNGLAGRIALPLFGTLNTLWCAKLIGPASGVELLLLPCIVIAGLSLLPSETLWRWGLIGLPMAAHLALSPVYGAGLLGFSPAQEAALFRLDLGSTATLLAFLGLVYGRLLPAAPEK